MAARTHLINQLNGFQNLVIDTSYYVRICNISRGVTQNKIFGNGGNYVPVYPFWTISSKVVYPPITGCIMLFDH